MRRFGLVPVVIAICAGITAQVADARASFRSNSPRQSQVQAPLLKPPLTACQTQSDLCITDPSRVYHAYFYNPAPGLCEYQITIYWGDKTSSQITLRDEVAIDHTYPGAGIYNYRATSPPGTGADCPAGEVRYTFEVPLSAEEAAAVGSAVKVARKELRLAKAFHRADTRQEKRKVGVRDRKLDKNAKGELKEWRELGLPTKRSDPEVSVKRGTYLAVYLALKAIVEETIEHNAHCLYGPLVPNCAPVECIDFAGSVGLRPTLRIDRRPTPPRRGREALARYVPPVC